MSLFIPVILKSNDVQGFKGFLCQARGDGESSVTYGRLLPAGDVSMTNNCEGVCLAVPGLEYVFEKTFYTYLHWCEV